MIEFKKLKQEEPYILFKKKYDEAEDKAQKNIEAITIASYNKEKNEVDSRLVNLKFIDEDKFIFFSNYNSPKAKAFKSHDQISGLFYWPSTNVQIRIKAKVSKSSVGYNKQYFKRRSPKKNALAISSIQSDKIESYDAVISKYKDVQENRDLSICPKYWGGFLFVPYYFEFWEGNEFRINKRLVFEEIDGHWKKYFIQP